MTHVDKIIAHGLILTMDSAFTIIEDGAIAIKGDTIVACDTTARIQTQYSSANTIDVRDQIIIPGLINAHTHVPMTLLRGLADDRRLDVWLIGYMMPIEREFVNPEFVHLGTLLACAEMIKSGITTFNDMYYFEDSVATATASTGMRAICGQTVLKFPAPDAESYEDSLQACREFVAKWHGHPLIIPAIAPHAPYTCTADILQACTKLAVEFDVPLHIHISETAGEVLESRRNHQMPVVPWVKKQGLFDAKVIAAHCVHIDDGEIHTLLNHKAGVAHNPTSNLKLASGIPPVKAMLDAGLNVGIGTDGAASNNDLDMFEETRLAALIAKVATDNPTSLPAKQALAMATILGARALHISHLTGSLEPGKRADITILNLNRLHNWPHFTHDPDSVYSQIVYAAKSSDVEHVLCNGQWLMRDQSLTTIQVEDLLAQAAAVALRIDAFLNTREGDVLSKLLAIGELQREESFEVQVKVRLDSAELADTLLAHSGVKVVQTSHYRQHDTYFEFGSHDASRIRYRDDDYLGGDGKVTNVRSRLTLTEPGKVREFNSAIVLSRSRFIAPATRPLRFYREYFKPNTERTIVKERKRWHVDYRDLRLYINLDQLLEPARDSYYLEIKSRTWSASDAEVKAQAIEELLEYANVGRDTLILEDYVAF